MEWLLYTGVCSIIFLLIHFSARAMSMPRLGWRDGVVLGWAIVFIPGIWMLFPIDVVILPSLVSAIVVGMAWRSVVPPIGVLVGGVLALLAFWKLSDIALLMAPAAWLTSYAMGCFAIVGLRHLHVPRFEVKTT